VIWSGGFQTAFDFAVFLQRMIELFSQLREESALFV